MFVFFHFADIDANLLLLLKAMQIYVLEGKAYI